MPISNDNDKNLQRDLSSRLNLLAGAQQERIAQNRSLSLKLPYINLVTFPIEESAITTASKSESKKADAVVFYRQGQDVRIGAVNPSLNELQDFKAEVATKLATVPQVYVISHRSLAAALGRYPKQIKQKQTLQHQIISSKKPQVVISEAIADLHDLGEHIKKLPPTELLNAVIAGAVHLSASDIHIEPRESDAQLRYRVDGVLQDVVTFDRSGWQTLLSRIKVLSRLKINIHDTPQDGSFVLNFSEKIYDVRVSLLPGGYGENIVLRVLVRGEGVLAMTALGMKEQDLKIVREELAKSTGMILVTGPTGSGKTTSLVSFLKEITTPEIKIITLEEPIEYHLEGVEQTQVNNDVGYTFAKGLRAILRQDPDVIMVGEIRDVATAEMALNAALTGHLVFTTLHTNDAPGAIARLVDMGAKPFVIAPATNLIMAQRLVRIICASCAEQYSPDQKLRDSILDTMDGLLPTIFSPATLRDPDLKFVKARGCNKCNNTGYKGRTGIFELFAVKGKIEEMILASSSTNDIREEALKTGMTTIIQDGYLKVIDQITTVEEIERVTNA